jgi:5-methylcytosine-specific restriction endonuclease McrA
MQRKKTLTLSQATKLFDKVFSEYIRRRDNGICFTCGLKKHWKQMQNGHYVSRAHRSLRWDEINCHCQCVGCNVFRNGNMTSYAVRLEKKYGIGILQKLEAKRHTIRKWSVHEMLAQIELYKAKINSLV